MIEALTGAFSGVVCALVAAVVVFAVMRSKRFDFWIIVTGAVFGVFWGAFNANAYFTWPEWFLTIVVLTLFGYVAPLVNQKMKERVSVDKENVLMWAFIVGCVVFVEWFIIAFFMWFYPMVGNTFMFTVIDAEGNELFYWFALNMPQIERDVIAYYLIMATPAFCFLVASPFALAISSYRQKRTRVAVATEKSGNTEKSTIQTVQPTW
jgi:Na+/H+ antiporter NhaC